MQRNGKKGKFNCKPGWYVSPRAFSRKDLHKHETLWYIILRTCKLQKCRQCLGFSFAVLERKCPSQSASLWPDSDERLHTSCLFNLNMKNISFSVAGSITMWRLRCLCPLVEIRMIFDSANVVSTQLVLKWREFTMLKEKCQCYTFWPTVNSLPSKESFAVSS